MLLEGCVRFLKDGREGMTARDWERSFEGFSNGKEIILELMNSMKPEHAPELCDKLSALYVYMFNRLTEGAFEKDIAKIDEVIGLMEYERDTWGLLMEKLASERGRGHGAADGSRAANGVGGAAGSGYGDGGDGGSGRLPLSVQA